MWSTDKVNLQTINEQHSGDTWPFLKSTLQSYYDVLRSNYFDGWTVKMFYSKS